MKLTPTLKLTRMLKVFLPALIILTAKSASAQITPVLGNPINYIYGLTGNGEIDEIDNLTAATKVVIKNTTYSGNSASSANGLAYNTFNGKFYYFKRNVTSTPQEFVSFDPKTNTVTQLHISTCADDIHTGCVSFDGNGYYTVDILGNLNYYNILTNTWKVITSSFLDQFGNNVTNVIKTQSAGDMAIDGSGNIWLLTSSSSNYALYKISAPMPTNSVASITVSRYIDPATATPTGNSFAGIAFNANGQIFVSTKNDNRLYRLINISTLSFVGTFTTGDTGNDLTSQNFPTAVLAVTWKSFDVNVQRNNYVTLNWTVAEEDSKGFYVQHSMDGMNWEDLTFIQTKNIPETDRNYTYSYTNNQNGKQYYRIRQVDIIGKEHYSDVKTITINNDKQNVEIWPNPAKDFLQVVNKDAQSTNSSIAQIVDLSGRVHSEKQLQSGVNTFNISALPTGIYVVRIQGSNGISFDKKIIKQ